MRQLLGAVERQLSDLLGDFRRMLLSIVAAIAPSIAWGQQPAPTLTIDSLAIGALVRVRPNAGAELRGTFGGLSGNSLILTGCDECATPAHIPLTSIHDLAVSRQLSHSQLTGKLFADAGWGALIGLGVGALAGTAYWRTQSELPPSCRGFCGRSSLAIPLFAAAGAGVGLAFGSVVGLDRRGDYWVGVELPR